jgi:hypothetical protein
MRNCMKPATWFSTIESNHCGTNLTKIKMKPAVRTKREDDCHSVSFLKQYTPSLWCSYSDNPSKSDRWSNCVQSRGEYIKKKLFCIIRKINKKYLGKECGHVLKISRIAVAHVLRENVLGKWNWMAGGKAQ